MSDIKYCKDCKHSRPDRGGWWFCLFLPLAPIFAWLAFQDQWRFAKCARSASPSTVSPWLRSRDRMHYCDNERDFDCGEEAKFFEPKRSLRREAGVK